MPVPYAESAQHCSPSDETLGGSPADPPNKGVSAQFSFEVANAKDENQLILNNLAIVTRVARSMHVRFAYQVELADLIAAGNLGLVSAAASFDPSRGVPFPRYAPIRIRGAMLDSVRDNDWGPRVLRRQARELQHAVATLRRRGIDYPDDEDICKEMGLSLVAFHTLLGDLDGLHISSLQDQHEDNDNDTELDYLPSADGEDPLTLRIGNERREKLIEAIDTLPQKERMVVSLYYYEELTMQDIAQVLEIARSRVCQLHAMAMLRMKAVLETTGTTL